MGPPESGLEESVGASHRGEGNPAVRAKADLRICPEKKAKGRRGILLPSPARKSV